MKQIITALTIMCLATACTKSNHTATPATNAAAGGHTGAYAAYPVQTATVPISGQATTPAARWAYAQDTSKWFVVESLGSTSATITFYFGIDAPDGGAPITLKYDVANAGDTIYCTFPGIYPCCKFTTDGQHGMAVSYEKTPGQGSYLPLVKL